MDAHDDDLLRFEAEGAEALPIADDEGYVEHAGARVWYSAYTHSAFGIHPTTFAEFTRRNAAAFFGESAMAAVAVPSATYPKPL
jgi:hypothetical protein